VLIAGEYCVHIRLRRPASDDLAQLVVSGRADSLTYEPVGITSLATPPDGYRLDRWSCLLGRGDQVFVTAADTIRQWRVQTGSGIVVLADGSPYVGQVVALSAPLPIGYIDIACRVVDVVDSSERYGFAYGTLSVHPEQGEESFTVIRQPNDEITFEIVAASRPRNPVARAFPPIARRLQRAATVRYLDAMKAAIAR
jgi:uncharacterized protein (UPF0548 family)